MNLSIVVSNRSKIKGKVTSFGLIKSNDINYNKNDLLLLYSVLPHWACRWHQF